MSCFPVLSMRQFPLLFGDSWPSTSHKSLSRKCYPAYIDSAQSSGHFIRILPIVKRCYVNATKVSWRVESCGGEGGDADTLALLEVEKLGAKGNQPISQSASSVVAWSPKENKHGVSGGTFDSIDFNVLFYNSHFRRYLCPQVSPNLQNFTLSATVDVERKGHQQYMTNIQGLGVSDCKAELSVCWSLTEARLQSDATRPCSIWWHAPHVRLRCGPKRGWRYISGLTCKLKPLPSPGSPPLFSLHCNFQQAKNAKTKA